MSDALKFGLVGFGSMGRNHARVLRSIDGVELVGIADSNPDLPDRIEGSHRVPSVEELVALGIDACVVAAPTSLHCEIGLKLADAGVATLLEKPLASSLKDANMLVEAFTNRKLLGAVGHIERFNPAIQALKLRINDGQLGDCYQISTQRQGPFPGRIGDVGVISDLSSHDVDLTSFVTDSHYQNVMAAIAHKSGRKHEDLVSATGQLSNGIIFNHIVNWLSPMKIRQTTVIGERGALVASTLNGTLTYFENSEAVNPWEGQANFRGVAEGNVTQYAIAKSEPLKNELEAFVNAVRTGDHSQVVSLESGRNTVQVCEAMITSATLQQAVNI